MNIKEKAEELGIDYLCTIKSYASAGVDPSIMGVGPVPASKKALDKAGLTIEDIDLVEANEAFAAQTLGVQRELNIPLEKLNIRGGAIALGHPYTATGVNLAAKAAGIETAECYCVSGENFRAGALEGEINQYQVSASQNLSLRGTVNGKMGTSSTQAFDDEAIAHSKERLKDYDKYRNLRLR